MMNIGDITGTIALIITLVWWFGITPRNIAKWAKEHKVRNRTVFTIYILFISFGIFDGIYHFVADPYGLGHNRWYYGGFWLLYSFLGLTFLVDSYQKLYIKWSRIQYTLLNIGRFVLVYAGNILFTIGLSLSMTRALIWLAIVVGVMLALMVVILITRRWRRERVRLIK